MSHIEDLIAQLCPNGVEYKMLGALEDLGIVKLGRGDVISRVDLLESPGEYPVYSSSALNNGELGRYGKYMFDDERITWSIDGGGKFFYRKAAKYSVTNVCGWLTVLDRQKVNTRYLYFVLITLWSGREYNYIVKAHPSVIREDYLIPLPPLQVQNEIVKILDKFTELETELETELHERKSQFEFYQNDLIAKLISKGFKKAAIKDLIAYEQPTKYLVASKDYDPVYPTPVLTAGQTFILGYTNEKSGIYPASKSNPVIIFDDFTTAHKWVDFPFKAKSGAMKMLRPAKSAEINFKFFFYLLNTIEVDHSQHARYWISEFAPMEIPLPPLDIQNQIAEILDKFKELEAVLTAELEARKKQYVYYRSKLLCFKELEKV